MWEQSLIECPWHRGQRDGQGWSGVFFPACVLGKILRSCAMSSRDDIRAIRGGCAECRGP